MDIYINPDKSPAAVQARISGTPISSLRLKRGANLNFSVVIIGSKAASNLRFGIKAKGDYEGSLLAYAEATTGQATDEGMKFDLSLTVASMALNEALDVGSGNAVAAASLSAVAEFAWQDDGAERISDTINTTLLNDIIRLATEAPEAAAGEYPAPDLVATKSWVNNKQATADTAGFVILGTDETISGRNVRPVGKNDAGGLTVDVSGLSAYEIAKANGFVGTEEAWLASLKGERGSKGEKGETGDSAYTVAQQNGFQGTQEEWLASLAQGALEETAEASPATGDESNYDAYGFGIIMPHSGKVTSLEIDCRQGSNTSGAEPVWCKVWKDGELVALSLNSQVHKAYETLKWEFPPFVAVAGQEYKFIFHKEGSKDSTSFSTDYKGCFRVVRKASSDGVGMIGDGGGYAASGATEWQPRYKLSFRNEVYSPFAHAVDPIAHLTAAEHSALSALLAKKDQLLALLNA